MRRKTKRLIVAISILAIIVGFVITALILGKRIIDDVYGTKLRGYEETLKVNRKGIFYANRDIVAGEQITEDIIVYEEILMGETTGAFSAEDIGSIALINIPERTVLNRAMLVREKPADDVRYTEYSCFHISSNIHSGDKIDVRIRYQNGEDYVVLSKKTAEKVSYNTSTCFLSVDEEEQLRMASAIYDTAVFKAVLYALVYEEPTLQEASKVTYLASLPVARLIYGDTVLSVGVVYDDFGHAVYRKTDRTALEERQRNATSAYGNVSNVKAANNEQQSNINGFGAEISSGYVDPDAETGEEQ